MRTAEAKSRFRFHTVVGIRRPRRSILLIYGEESEFILGMINVLVFRNYYFRTKMKHDDSGGTPFVFFLLARVSVPHNFWKVEYQFRLPKACLSKAVLRT